MYRFTSSECSFIASEIEQKIISLEQRIDNLKTTQDIIGDEISNLVLMIDDLEEEIHQEEYALDESDIQAFENDPAESMAEEEETDPELN